MPDDRYQGLLNALRYMALAMRAPRPESRQVVTEMAETWQRLATETVSDEAFSELELTEPYDGLPNDLRLRWGEYA
jgi:hypothetical protein